MLGVAKKGWIGVDMGIGAIKVAQLQRKGSRYALVDAAIVPRQSASYMESDTEDGSLPCQDCILTGLSMANRVSGRKAAAVLSMDACEYHVVSPGQGRVSRDVIQRELAATAPLDWHDRTYDAWSIDTPQASDKLSSVLGVISTDVRFVERAAADIVQARLDCQTIDSVPTSLARATQMMVGADKAPLVALDWGFSQATLCVVQCGKPLYVRSLKKAAFSSLVGHLSDAVSCSHSSAIGLLQRFGVAGANSTVERAELIEEVLRPNLERLAAEVRRTLQFIRSHHRNLAVQRIVLFGGGATVVGMTEFLSQALGIEVRPWQPNPELLLLPDQMPAHAVLLAHSIAASALKWERN